MSLDDDIARIAALRGRKLEDVQQAERQRRRVSAERVRAAFFSHGEPNIEMRAHDLLPPAVRHALSQLPYAASALWCRELLHLLDERTLIEALKAEIPEVQRILAAHDRGVP